ncbi:hypothetical protein GLOTRDRAFT_95188 [Gloeophyllum trabeum ATCC 11539]|uniref:Uncharacterized protein n=1 Tax=Gloeophyllum trabeum (strain ATCC 11539 / FP-39264 / Madison 617) TaxID=670483 RepID=S7Q0F0_GLOTA|nr:uncharacterized protein GLOTRDRAFT_95188 [Gloeophyllum trabeum ATCC 11539]EPQ53178.1 hypothetical protein GLOTRDRAFT_95188 [Gloeophyllum trabeum ATCC 11539]
MHPRLAELWRRNVFSIDPEDDYRIVWFRDPRTVCAPELLSHIPAHLRLPSVPEELRPNYWALRGHLKESLFDNVTDCDIHSDFEFADLSATCDQAFGDDPWEEPVPLTDPVWQTRLGKMLFEWIMLTDRRLHEREQTGESASAEEPVDTAGSSLVLKERKAQT